MTASICMRLMILLFRLVDIGMNIPLIATMIRGTIVQNESGSWLLCTDCDTERVNIIQNGDKNEICTNTYTYAYKSESCHSQVD